MGGAALAVAMGMSASEQVAADVSPPGHLSRADPGGRGFSTVKLHNYSATFFRLGGR